jgi:subtilisin family serine protease
MVAVLLVMPPQAAAQPDLIRSLQWQVKTMNLAEVHKKSAGAGITVAVVDSGVDGNHPDLTGQLVQGPPGSNFDGDGRGTGLAGIIAGHGHTSSSSATTVTPTPTPGTATVSLAAQQNDAGVLGIAPKAKILPVAFAPGIGENGDPDKLASGIELAIHRGANIICVARGVSPSERLQFAIDVAVQRGVLVVSADASAWPASYPGVLTAIPADSSGNVATLAASGRMTGITVPGEKLITTNLASGYREADAPGAAAAVLSGAAAVLWSAYPNATAEQITQLLRNTATDSGATGPDIRFGSGSLNLSRALDTGLPKPGPTATPSTSAPADAPAPAQPGNTVANPLFSSGDWRRWLVILPLLGFFAAAAFWSYRRGSRLEESAEAKPAE